MANNYVNCPKCGTYQPFNKKGICQICGAELDSPDSGEPNYSPPPTMTTPIMSVGAPPNSIEDAIRQHMLTEHDEQIEGKFGPSDEDDEDELPLHDEEAHFPEEDGEALKVYILLPPELVSVIINKPWFDEECFEAVPSRKSQDWIKGHYFVPMPRVEQNFG